MIELARHLVGGERVQRPTDITRTGRVIECCQLFATVRWSDGSTEDVDTLFHGLDIERRGGSYGYRYICALPVPTN
jgi:hypothetical protein